MEHVILVGMMGAGKTTVGRIISHVTGRNFIDIDQLIEKQTGMSIFEIITEHGEDYFRKIEKDVILSLSPKFPFVISTGGGAVMDNDVFNFFKSIGKIVYLKTSPDVLYKRTANVEVRPLLKEGNRLSILRDLLKKRESRYHEADVVIETDNSTPNEIAEKIIMRLQL
jgi:shikimate kinase